MKKFATVATGVTAFLTSLLLSMSLSIPANAYTTVYSIWGTYGPILGISYANQAVTHNNSGYPAGQVALKTTNGTTIPAGWAGFEDTVYINGTVCISSPTQYTTSAISSAGTLGGATGKNCGHGVYTSKGVTSSYNGNGYSRYYTYESPAMNY